MIYAPINVNHHGPSSSPGESDMDVSVRIYTLTFTEKSLPISTIFNVRIMSVSIAKNPVGYLGHLGFTLLGV